MTHAFMLIHKNDAAMIDISLHYFFNKWYHYDNSNQCLKTMIFIALSVYQNQLNLIVSVYASR